MANKKDDYGIMRQYLRFSTLGIEAGMALLAGMWLGNKADEYWGLDPWGKVWGFAVGIGVSIKNLSRLLRQLKEDDRNTPYKD
ncbi:MAG: AtpZ/AtpI family protein [Deltaproteobacteria bacterium]|nr:AtpZ/AtpI family protein [Deltaproteobacteria bacterium]